MPNARPKPPSPPGILAGEACSVRSSLCDVIPLTIRARTYGVYPSQPQSHCRNARYTHEITSFFRPATSIRAITFLKTLRMCESLVAGFRNITSILRQNSSVMLSSLALVEFALLDSYQRKMPVKPKSMDGSMSSSLSFPICPTIVVMNCFISEMGVKAVGSLQVNDRFFINFTQLAILDTTRESMSPPRFDSFLNHTCQQANA